MKSSLYSIPLIQRIGLKKFKPGNAIVEYSLIGALIALASLASLGILGQSVSNILSRLQSTLSPSSKTTQISQAPLPQGSPSLPNGPASSSTPSTTSPAPQSTGIVGSPQVSQPYTPAQTAGANGIQIVDSYADVFTQLANQLSANPSTDSELLALIQKVAQDGHNAANTERSVLTYTQYVSTPDGSFNFSGIQSGYNASKAALLDYLNVHPQALPPETTQLIQTASENITQQMIDFVGSGNTAKLNALNINQKFRDDNANAQGTTYVDTQASTICNTGNCTE